MLILHFLSCEFSHTSHFLYLLEREILQKHVIQDDTQTPHVHLLVVHVDVTVNDFGCDVESRPAFGVHHLLICQQLTQSEVGYLY